MFSTCALLLLSAVTGPRFIEDDFGKALSTAKQQKKLLFVDAWAPWCHTCVFMREHVLTTTAFSVFEKDVVFAGIDTERTKSAAFLAKYPVEVWPTLFFIDPTTEKVVFKWEGSADAKQMEALLDAAKHAGDADALFAAGDKAQAADRFIAAKTGTSSNGREVLSMLTALYGVKRHDVCAQTASEAAPGLTHPGDRLNAVLWGLTCVLELPLGDAARTKLLPALLKQGRDVLSLEGTLADDVSCIYELLVEERSQAKDEAGVIALALPWLAFLEKSAALSPTSGARAAFDAHRLSAALSAKQPARIIDALALSELQSPKDFNPPARLSVALRELGRFDEALAAINRALAKCQEGSRRVCLFKSKAALLAAKGDKAGTAQVIRDGLDYAKRQPVSKGLTRCRTALEAVGTP